MFSTKKNNAVIAGGGTSIIGQAVTLTGDIASTADIRIDGVVKGNVKSAARILVGPEGVVEGNLDSLQADIMGFVKGNIKVKELLSLRENAVINGNIHVGKLQVEPTVILNGNCYMNSNVVVEMVKETHEQPKVLSKK
ncbi:MAG: polymer-forming cytoskeletal protein [Chitinophagaceae bacterium]|nr:polymer-forming cytoskeletal protein [Chitinophagaceae bacterium]